MHACSRHLQVTTGTWEVTSDTVRYLQTELNSTAGFESQGRKQSKAKEGESKEEKEKGKRENGEDAQGKTVDWPALGARRR